MSAGMKLGVVLALALGLSGCATQNKPMLLDASAVPTTEADVGEDVIGGKTATSQAVVDEEEDQTHSGEGLEQKDEGEFGGEETPEGLGDEGGEEKTAGTRNPLNPEEAPQGEEFSFTPFEARDPELVIHQGVGYLYTTNIFPFGPPINVPLWKSTDLSNWDPVGDALEKVGSWAEDSWTWAPGVIGVGGQWLLFYTARVLGTTTDSAYPAGVQCIGLAVASVPTGPFVDGDSSPFICQESLGGSIDPSPFRDDDGSLWLTWKADTNAPHVNGTACIYAQRLNSSAVRLLGESTNLLCRDQDWEWPLIENPDFFRDSEGDLWLSYSAGWWDSASYSTGIASCERPMGPCQKEGQWLTTGDGLVGPGGVTFVTDGEDDYVVVCSWSGGAGFGEGGTGVTGVVQLARVIKHVRSQRETTTTLEGECYTAPPEFTEVGEGREIDWVPQRVDSIASLPTLSLQPSTRVAPLGLTTTTTLVARFEPLSPALTTTTTLVARFEPLSPALTTTTTLVARFEPLSPALTTTTTTTPFSRVIPRRG
ncbi:MAG: family 43 glycosylhydrolase [Actinobacteria bacterium]|nr:family 43 glycosylhydrolase [Actinomycetota bacterium]MBT5504175.1 family 43 glycosylhydrolase [Actinomycetota bacterium]MBT5704529.1 family 43 glycosylhydrolase [Actinomycetota bacterium]MBT6970983.1 family 43 glycosylhydrolase [Actinomycetota bacterium]MBT7471866.1 family 43 glycosylhydrolase [Actinomycetota bacterium]